MVLHKHPFLISSERGRHMQIQRQHTLSVCTLYRRDINGGMCVRLYVMFDVNVEQINVQSPFRQMCAMVRGLKWEVLIRLDVSCVRHLTP